MGQPFLCRIPVAFVGQLGEVTWIQKLGKQRAQWNKDGREIHGPSAAVLVSAKVTGGNSCTPPRGPSEEAA